MRSPLLAAAALLLLATAASAECMRHPVATVALKTDAQGGVYVPMTISGHSVNLLIDTGSIDSMLTKSTVAALGLTPVSLGGDYLVLFGGDRIDHYVTGHGIVFGGLRTPSMNFLVMPDGHMPPELGGTFAPDILRAYDDELDFARATLTLYAPLRCAAGAVPWTDGPHSRIDFIFDDDGHIALPVTLDGQALLPRLDTGSSRSLISLEAAEEIFGIDPKSPLLTPDFDADLGGRFYHYPFKSLTFGGVAIEAPDLALVPDAQSQLPGGRRFILGMNVLRRLHLFIAYREKRLYLTLASSSAP